jgi:hypothetical protein
MKINNDNGLLKRAKDLIDSFYNSKAGMSARKLTAFALILMMRYVHVNHVDKTNAVEVLWVDAILVLLLLGIVTAENLIQFRYGGAGEKKEAEKSDVAEK